MKFVLLIATVFTLALSGCERASDPSAGSATACKTYEAQLKECDSNDTSHKVTIYTDPVRFEPENICVERGRSIEFTLDPVPDGQEGTAAIIPDEYENSWLTGTNSPAMDKIKIKVPKWVDKGKTYKYNFIMNDGSCVDPRVEVTR